MENSSMPVVILIVIMLVVSFSCHFSIKDYRKAVIYSAIISAVLFQIVGYFVIGYFDPFAIIALPITGVITALVSAVIGIPFKKNRSV